MSENKARLILAHGAGAGSDSDFMQEMAQALKSRQIDVVLFDFDYMKVIKETGKKRPPERMPKLQEQWQRQIDEVVNETKDDDLPLFIGGKSMGGRVASTLYQEADVNGCVCLGYPFHPPGKPEKLRTEHLQALARPLLVVQGERDTFGTRAEVQTYSLSSEIDIVYLADGDHSFKPRKASGVTLEQNMMQAADAIASFVTSHL